MLYITRGYSAPETTEATERAAALAEKSGNLTQLVRQLGYVRCLSASQFRATYPRPARLPTRRSSCLSRRQSHQYRASAHALQTIARYYRGDLAGAEKHFAAGLKFFDDPGFRRVPGVARMDLRCRKLERVDARSPSRSCCANAMARDDGSCEIGTTRYDSDSRGILRCRTPELTWENTSKPKPLAAQRARVSRNINSRS